MTPHRRFHTFNDHLRSRFGEKLQRVTLSGGLICPHPDGEEACPFCTEAVRIDPDYRHGYPVHEQIRRGVNFSRRRGEAAPHLMVSLPPTPGPCPPADHLRATLEVMAQDNVAVISVSARPECLSEEFMRVLSEFATTEREVWLDLESLPENWPATRDDRVRVGVMIDLERGAGGPPEHGVPLTVEEAAERVQRLKPDAVGLLAPAIINGSPEAERYQRGEIEEEELEAFADRAAQFLELIPADVAVHPIVLFRAADTILGPSWVLNRQKVQEAVGLALEERGTTQGAGYSSGRAEGQ